MLPWSIMLIFNTDFQPTFVTYSQGQLDQVVADYAAAKAKHDAAKTTNGRLLSNIQFAAILSYISLLESVEYEERYDNGEFSIKENIVNPC